MPMWKSHWGFKREPFAEDESPYVSLPSHDEAVARLVHAIESGERRASLTAEAGLGKSTGSAPGVRGDADPRRRFVLLSCPRRRHVCCLAMLAERLGERVGREPSRLACWRALERAVRLASIQGMHVVIGIDDCRDPQTPQSERDIESARKPGSRRRARITVIRGRPAEAIAAMRSALRAWTPAIWLESLTRSRGRALLTTKLASAGCDERDFHRTRSHAAALPGCRRPAGHRAARHALLDGRRSPRARGHSARARRLGRASRAPRSDWGEWRTSPRASRAG